MRCAVALLGVLLAAAGAAPARASEWGGIVPASSTMESVRAQYGGPTRTQAQKLDNYDTATWIYDGAQAPRGLVRMTVDFGILQAGGYRRDVVRSLKLEPKPGVFDRRVVLAGWGPPDRAGQQGGAEVFVYAEGLVVLFDKEGREAQSMMFTPPQPLEPATPSR
jgi:hypothetical protein